MWRYSGGRSHFGGAGVGGGFGALRHSVPSGVLSSPGFLGAVVWALVVGAYLLRLAVGAGGGLPISRAFCANTSGALLTNH